MINKLFPSEVGKISMTLTPMVYTARLMKQKYPDCKVVFVGPCAAKKLEAIREDIRSDVDFVLTFEELQGMFEAKEINFETIEPMYDLNEGSAAGRGFAVSGGVAKAVADRIAVEHPDMDVKTARAKGLQDCRKLMLLAKAGKYNGYLLEGMACPGGCVAGAGTLLPVDLASKVVGRYQSEADMEDPADSPYRDKCHQLD
jgi:iron only hydrogenase large subunit-like protein